MTLKSLLVHYVIEIGSFTIPSLQKANLKRKPSGREGRKQRRGDREITLVASDAAKSTLDNSSTLLCLLSYPPPPPYFFVLMHLTWYLSFLFCSIRVCSFYFLSSLPNLSITCKVDSKVDKKYSIGVFTTKMKRMNRQSSLSLLDISTIIKFKFYDFI